MTLTAQDIAELVEGTLMDDGGGQVSGVSGIEGATSADLVGLEDPKMIERAQACEAALFLVSPKLAESLERPRVVVAHPMVSLNRVIDALNLDPPAELDPGVHPTASVHPEAQLGDGVRVGPQVSVGARVKIGTGTCLHPGAVIQSDAVLGARCTVHPNAVIGPRVVLGNDVVIGATAVIGFPGFGFGAGAAGAVRLRHTGTVRIGDRAEIGAGVTIDRSKFGATVIGNDVMLDNQVHIGHNCVLGDRTMVAAQAGFAGSTELGEDCLIGGQAGFSGHQKLANKVLIAAKAGVKGNLTAGNYFGFVAKESIQAMRELSSVSKLPTALRQLKALTAEVAELRKKLDGEETPPPQA